jgi:hypothetical protein
MEETAQATQRYSRLGKMKPVMVVEAVAINEEEIKDKSSSSICHQYSHIVVVSSNMWNATSGHLFDGSSLELVSLRVLVKILVSTLPNTTPSKQ